jgi:hypothetical protein
MQIAERVLMAASCLSLVVVAACGGGGGASITEPTPTSGAGSSTIVGTVNGGSPVSSMTSATAGPSGATAPASSLVVTVMGTNLSAFVDVLGHFEIAGVPSGLVRLQFRDAGVDATVQIPNVGSEELIQIRVSVSGTTATIVSEERSTGKVSLCHRTESGSYHQIDVSVSAEPAHRGHGDAKVGEAVPADPTMVFDANCRPVAGTVRAEVNIEKLTNGQDADTAPGPKIVIGRPVTWTYVVTNTGTVQLTNVTVVDDRNVTITCGKTTLEPGESMTCTGSGTATVGQYRNVGTVTASSTVGPATDSDASHYLGVEDDDETEAKVSLCHRTGNGSYHLITVSVSAEAAHRAHGDAKIGEAVPGQAGKVFGPNCSVQ